MAVTSCLYEVMKSEQPLISLLFASAWLFLLPVARFRVTLQPFYCGSVCYTSTYKLIGRFSDKGRVEVELVIFIMDLNVDYRSISNSLLQIERFPRASGSYD